MQMEEFMKENGINRIKKVLELSNIQMEEFMKETG